MCLSVIRRKTRWQLDSNDYGFISAVLHSGINEKVRCGSKLTSVLLFGCGIVVEAILVFVSASGQGGAPSACIVYEQIALKMRI